MSSLPSCRLPLMATPHARATRRHGRSKVLAFVLLAGMLALTSAPVCGNTTDVDPMACCERHGHQQSSERNDHCARADAARQPETGNCSAADDLSKRGDTAAQCCSRGRLTYPQIKTQPSVSVHAVLPMASVIKPPPCRAASAVRLALREIPLKILSTPLYTLTATYRI